MKLQPFLDLALADVNVCVLWNYAVRKSQFTDSWVGQHVYVLSTLSEVWFNIAQSIDFLVYGPQHASRQHHPRSLGSLHIVQGGQWQHIALRVLPWREELLQSCRASFHQGRLQSDARPSGATATITYNNINNYSHVRRRFLEWSQHISQQTLWHWQAYVALSRCRRAKDLWIEGAYYAMLRIVTYCSVRMAKWATNSWARAAASWCRWMGSGLCARGGGPNLGWVAVVSRYLLVDSAGVRTIRSTWVIKYRYIDQYCII